MTPILPPDKLREILWDSAALSDSLMAEAMTAIQALATDALVAELRAIYDEWYKKPDGTYDPIEPLSIEATISDRIAQLSQRNFDAVPDLPSEQGDGYV